VQDQPLVRVPPEGLRHDFLELRLDFVRSLPRRETRAIADAEYVRVDSERLFPEGGVEHDVGRLPPDAGKCLELFARPRDLAAVLIDKRLAESDDVLRLGVEQADGLDRLA